MRDWPPLWLALGLILAWLTGSTWSVPLFGWACVGLGAGMMLAAVFEMSRQKTTVIPHRDPDALVTSGVFRVTRNPIYLGDALVLLGASLILGSLPGLLAVPVFCWIIQRRFILAEEARLAQAFGAAFESYRNATSRWIGPF